MRMTISFYVLSAMCILAMSTSLSYAQVDPLMAAPTPADAAMAPQSPGVDPAQQPPVSAAPAPAAIPVELRILQKVQEELKEKFRSNIYTPANIPSLFFSPTQQSLLNSARQGLTNSLGDGSIEGLEDGEVGGEGTLTSAPSVTSIFLSGIVFNAKDNWTIWLNGGRITPKNIPKEIIDINVSQEFIELKWFDAATNQIFPVRLRPNQKFDFEKKIFLPGQ